MSLKKKIYVAEEEGMGCKSKLHSITPVADVIKNLPSTRYYGSKKKLLPWIFDNIKSLKFKTVLDGFGGTGSVSLLFKAMGKDITYHDAFTFNRDVAETVLSNSLAVDADSFYDLINGVDLSEGVIYDHFKGIFYTDDENRWLDGFIKKLRASDLSGSQVSLFRYVLFQACLKKRPFNLFHRANLSIRLNESVSRSFGNKATWERSFEELMFQSYTELSNRLVQSRSKICISDVASITEVEPDYDLVYLDPPYVSLKEKNNQDNYWKRYHFLEGLSNYENWEDQIDDHSKIKLMRQPDCFVEWSRKATFKEKLFELIEKHRQSTVVLSYVSEAYPDESEITDHFESIFPNVSIHSIDHTHALCKKQKRELLFIGKYQ